MCYFFLPDSVYPCCYVSALNHCNAVGGFLLLLWVAAQPGLGEGRDLHAFPCSGLAGASCPCMALALLLSSPHLICLQPLFSPLCPQPSLHSAPPPLSPALPPSQPPHCHPSLPFAPPPFRPSSSLPPLSLPCPQPSLPSAIYHNAVCWVSAECGTGLAMLNFISNLWWRVLICGKQVLLQVSTTKSICLLALLKLGKAVI